jgi:hypothetical protein
MLVQMDETQIRTLEDVEQFLAGTADTSLKLQGGKDEVYAWIQHTLVRFRYIKPDDENNLHQDHYRL